MRPDLAALASDWGEDEDTAVVVLESPEIRPPKRARRATLPRGSWVDCPRAVLRVA